MPSLFFFVPFVNHMYKSWRKKYRLNLLRIRKHSESPQHFCPPAWLFLGFVIRSLSSVLLAKPVFLKLCINFSQGSLCHCTSQGLVHSICTFDWLKLSMATGRIPANHAHFEVRCTQIHACMEALPDRIFMQVTNDTNGREGGGVLSFRNVIQI